MINSRYPTPVIVRYECGCIGFPPDANDQALILKACDHDGRYDLGEGHCFSFRGGFSRSKIVESLSSTDLGKLVTEIACLIGDGERLREVRMLLSIPKSK